MVKEKNLYRCWIKQTMYTKVGHVMSRINAIFTPPCGRSHLVSCVLWISGCVYLTTFDTKTSRVLIAPCHVGSRGFIMAFSCDVLWSNYICQHNARIFSNSIYVHSPTWSIIAVSFRWEKQTVLQYVMQLRRDGDEPNGTY